MLVELRDVEVHIEPELILTQALDDGDLIVDTVIRECISVGGDECVLDAIDNDDILKYVKEYDLDIEINMYDRVLRAVAEFTEIDRAKLLWQLLKCKEV